MSTRADGTLVVHAQAESSIGTAWTMTELDSVNAILALRGAWLFDQTLDLPRLRDGLSRLLSFYPHLAGRMVRGQTVELCNRGVPFTVGSRQALSVQDVLARPSLAHRFAPRLHPLLMSRGYARPLKIKVTRLRNGTLLNVSCSHACLDGRGFYTFVQSWGRICAGRPFPIPVLDPSLVPCPGKRPKNEVLQSAANEGWSKLSPWTMARMIALAALGRLGQRSEALHFPEAALRQLRKTAARQGGCTGLRTFEALSAHLTRLCVRLVGLPQGTPCSQVTVLDARRRVPSLPAAYAGNAAFVVTSAKFSAGAPLGEVAERIHQGLDPFVTVPSPRLVEQVTLAREIVRHKRLIVPYDAAAMYASPPTLTYVNNFSTLPVYDVDFGEQGSPITPVRVFPHDLPDPVLVWPAPPDQDGVDVYLAGAYARALRKLARDDPWFSELRSFETLRS